MTNDTDEYQRRALYLHWALEAFKAAGFNDRAVPITSRMLAEKAQTDPVAAEISTAMFVLICKWWNPYRIEQTAADRYEVIAELRDEQLTATELAEL
ncbi:hypothetical protein C3469_04335 [Mycobacterium kansasii]|uniref:hypothetical protein n=1 Tax=Mycobacterium kansasii TaxID=1768 RepID=UPI000CDD1BD4|nr:hypothetical protein [Mycobacterium kansasii]POY04857.1 hypothetical protein C3479_00175 [Mycobacterium kansasii]POY29131.1 hypothetical protein C3469_04335 [Mycobacterium kansasii]POY34237.1 hypothetical protein C3478_02255 [Mycobacterium kansasii]